MQVKSYEDGIKVSVLDVETLKIKIHNTIGIKVEATDNCIIYKHKKDGIVHIVSKEIEQSDIVNTGKSPGIVAGGNISIVSSRGVSIAIGENIIQNNVRRSSASDSTATVTVPAGAEIEVEDVPNIIMEDSVRRQIKMKEAD